MTLLTRIGLTESEAVFFLAVYKYPKSTIRTIQQRCGVSLATAYRTYENLREKKLLTSSPTSWKKNIEAVSLRTLADRLGRESLKLRKVEYELKKMENLMLLSSMQVTQEPIEILTDQNQLTEHCYSLLNAEWEHIYAYGSGEKAYEIPGYQAMHDFVSMRARRGKTIDVIFTELGDHTRELLVKNERELRHGKLSIDESCQSSMTYMYSRQITIWQKDPELGNRAVLINDPGLVRMYINQFKSIWAKV